MSAPSLFPFAASVLCLSLFACGSEPDEPQYDPWGGADGGDDAGPPSDTDPMASDDGNGDAGDDDAGDDSPPGDDGPGDEGGTDSTGEEEPPGSPYAGGWDIGTCQDDIVPTGTEVGQVVPDFLLYDQFGDQVRLHDFCHKAVYIIAGAFW